LQGARAARVEYATGDVDVAFGVAVEEDLVAVEVVEESEK